jgi:hypothetical protein
VCPPCPWCIVQVAVVDCRDDVSAASIQCKQLVSCGSHVQLADINSGCGCCELSAATQAAAAGLCLLLVHCCSHQCMAQTQGRYAAAAATGAVAVTRAQLACPAGLIVTVFGPHSS